MINFSKQLPQTTTVIQSKQNEQYSKSSNERHLEAVYDICGATCISDAVICLIIGIQDDDIDDDDDDNDNDGAH